MLATRSSKCKNENEDQAHVSEYLDKSSAKDSTEMDEVQSHNHEKIDGIDEKILTTKDRIISTKAA